MDAKLNFQPLNETPNSYEAEEKKDIQNINFKLLKNKPKIIENFLIISTAAQTNSKRQT